MKIICISDLHRHFPLDLPKGDLLIAAGDFDIRDQYDLDNVIDYFIELPYKDVVFIGGNHDIYLDKLWQNNISLKTPKHIHYLFNESIEIEGIKIWGSPYSPTFGVGWVFNGSLEELKTIWSTIPEDTDIVVSHCPCFGINDQVRGISQGCPALRNRIKEIKPKLHVSGHLHEHGGKVYCDKHTIYANSSIMDEFYEPTNKPVVIEYDQI